ncbi:hypothetical protein M0R89_03265 [Halorussus limi]|uniref:DUF7096 domain-containing protein n=1 Tax=Halorussus limi TaxID=2938695 RepID=A0A8U0HVF2_9EURY|nr:hypothetical protein [Halorussus limi]UPV75095.1 hypothetical protein M0R89_03265 [Halorussus limi]
MSPYRAVLLALFVVGGALSAAPVGATVHDGGEATPEIAAPTGDRVGLADARPIPAVSDASTANNSTDNSSLGTDISSFMQSSAAEVDGAVETGMWSAAFNSTENRSVRVELVEKRTAELRKRLAQLRERRRELVAQREAGNLSETAYKAKVSRLLGEINSLQSAIDTTTKRAAEANANVEALGGLRTQAKNLTGPEIAAVAQNVTGVGDGRRGPPNGVGASAGNGNGVGAGNGSAAANGTTPGNGNPGNGNGAAGDGNGVGNGIADAGNETGADNGTGVGNGNGLGSGTGNGTGAGNGNGTAVGNATTNGTRGPPSDASGAAITRGSQGDPATASSGIVGRVSTAFVPGVGAFGAV